MRKILSFLIIIIVFFFVDVHAVDYKNVGKDKLIYEITELKLTDKGLYIKGWAFIGESQHFSSSSNYKGEIILKAARSTLNYPITFTYKNMSELMRLDNVPKCKIDEFNKQGRECYYELSNVGFNLLIPYDDLEIDARYVISIAIEAQDAKVAYKTSVLAPTQNSIIALDNKKIIINAALERTHFFVNHEFVYARLKPNKDGPLLMNSESNSKHGNYTYFEMYSQFNKILEYRIINDVSWYHVKGKIDGIKNDMYIVNEGNDYDLWIASLFVQYNGSLTSILVNKKDNTLPKLYLEDCEIYLGDTSFNPYDHAFAYDDMDGEIDPIIIKSNLNINRIGKYLIYFSATNSNGKVVRDKMTITVIERPKVNTAPIINANDRTIYLNEQIDYLKDVSAYDLEDGDLTSSIIVTKKINTGKLGIQQACYFVEDHEKLGTTKCINIEVKMINNEKGNNRLRFILINNPFYNESKPENWNYQHLINALKQETAIKTEKY